MMIIKMYEIFVFLDLILLEFPDKGKINHHNCKLAMKIHIIKFFRQLSYHHVYLMDNHESVLCSVDISTKEE